MYNHLLDTFVSVADEKSISKASGKLSISTVAVMKQIRKLENQLGFKLFDTSNKGCVLTEDGLKVYEGAKKIIAYSNKIMNGIRPSECITLKLGTSFYNSSELFFDVWNQIANKFNNVKIELVPVEENKLSLNILYNGNVDLLASLYDLYEKPRCENVQIGTCKHVLVVPKNHSLASHKTIKMTDFENTTVYVPEKGVFLSFDDLVEEIKDNVDSAVFIETKSDTYLSKLMNDSMNNNALFFATDSLNNKHPNLVSIPLEFGKDVPYCLFYDRKLIKEHPELKKILDSCKTI